MARCENPFKIDRNGTKYYLDWTCPRCGGAGGGPQWAYTGWTCYECAGTGERKDPKVVKEYTPEYEAKLAERRAARHERELNKEAQENGFETYEAWQAAIAEKNRILQEEKEREAALEKARKAISQYVGEVGQRITAIGAFEKTAWFDVRDPFGRPERMYVHTFKTPDGNVLIWKTKKSLDQDLGRGEPVEITGTVKEHKEYKDEKQTALIRCKITLPGRAG